MVSSLSTPAAPHWLHWTQGGGGHGEVSTALTIEMDLVVYLLAALMVPFE